MSARLAGVLLVAAAVALGTWTVAWWAVAPVAMAAGWFWRGWFNWRWVGPGAMLGWAALLGVDALGGRLGVLARELGGVVHAPAWALVVVSLLVPAVLGWSAAAVGSAFTPNTER